MWVIMRVRRSHCSPIESRSSNLTASSIEVHPVRKVSTPPLIDVNGVFSYEGDVRVELGDEL